MSVIVRKAEEQDIPAIQSLAKLVLHEAFLGDEARLERTFNRVYSQDALEKTLRSTGATMLLAFEGEQITGMCQFGSPIMDDCEDRKEIYRLYLHPDYLNAEVGTALLKSVESFLNQEVKVKRVSVYVNPDSNMSMVKFYAAQGFHHEQVEDKDDEWYMEKTL